MAQFDDLGFLPVQLDVQSLTDRFHLGQTLMEVFFAGVDEVAIIIVPGIVFYTQVLLDGMVQGAARCEGQNLADLASQSEAAGSEGGHDIIHRLADPGIVEILPDNAPDLIVVDVLIEL